MVVLLFVSRVPEDEVHEHGCSNGGVIGRQAPANQLVNELLERLLRSESKRENGRNEFRCVWVPTQLTSSTRCQRLNPLRPVSFHRQQDRCDNPISDSSEQMLFVVKVPIQRTLLDAQFGCDPSHSECM